METTLTEILLRKESVLLMGATWSLLTAARKALPPKARDSAWLVRLAPLFPLVLCSFGAWIPGVLPASAPVAERILTGLILGQATGHAHKILGQTILGDDKRIPARRRKAVPVDPEKTPTA